MAYVENRGTFKSRHKPRKKRDGSTVYSLMKIAGSKPDNTRRSSAGHRLVLKALHVLLCMIYQSDKSL